MDLRKGCAKNENTKSSFAFRHRQGGTERGNISCSKLDEIISKSCFHVHDLIVSHVINLEACAGDVSLTSTSVILVPAPFARTITITKLYISKPSDSV